MNVELLTPASILPEAGTSVDSSPEMALEEHQSQVNREVGATALSNLVLDPSPAEKAPEDGTQQQNKVDQPNAQVEEEIIKTLGKLVSLQQANWDVNSYLAVERVGGTPLPVASPPITHMSGAIHHLN